MWRCGEGRHKSCPQAKVGLCSHSGLPSLGSSLLRHSNHKPHNSELLVAFSEASRGLVVELILSMDKALFPKRTGSGFSKPPPGTLVCDRVLVGLFLRRTSQTSGYTEVVPEQLLHREYPQHFSPGREHCSCLRRHVASGTVAGGSSEFRASLVYITRIPGWTGLLNET